METKDIFNDFIKNNSKEDIVNGAERDYDSTFGYVMGLLKDNYNISKIEAYPIVEQVLKEYKLEMYAQI